MSKRSALDTVKLQSFDASDFLSWKLQVQLGMKEREMFYTVQSDFATTQEDVDEYQWNKDEDFCRDFLLNSLNPRLALTYNAYKTAKEIWDRLNAQFQKEEGLSKSLIGEKFFNFRFKANLPITSQIIELENLRLKLEDDQSEMSDNLFVYLILSKLPTEWIVFKTEMHRLKEKITLDDLKRFIHIEDQNIAGRSLEQVVQPPQAVNFVSRPSKAPRKPPAPKSDTPAQLAVKKPATKRKKGKCNNCGKWGHWAAECWGPKKQKEVVPQHAANMVVDNSDPKSFVAMIGSSRHGSSSEWWLDSGATCHVTNDRNLLTKVTAVKDRVENCNGGETEVTHAGTAELVLSSVLSGSMRRITSQSSEKFVSVSANTPSKSALLSDAEILSGSCDDHGGVIVEVNGAPMSYDTFLSSLRASISQWRQQGKKGVWLKLPIEHANLVQPAIEEGFWYHHAEPSYLMLVYWIPASKHTLPVNATHRVGVGAFVLNSKREVLAVQEKSGKLSGSGFWKLPTGVVEQGEDIFAAAVREVKEETGVDADFLEVLAFRQSHGSFFEKSDLFFVCLMKPLTFDIEKQESEIEAAEYHQWQIAPRYYYHHEMVLALTICGRTSAYS